jgi:hypothetical protein
MPGLAIGVRITDFTRAIFSGLRKCIELGEKRYNKVIFPDGLGPDWISFSLNFDNI